MNFGKIFTILVSLMPVLTCFAQEDVHEGSSSKIYAKIYGSYGLLTPGSFRGISNNDNNNVKVVKVQKLGMGGGIRAGFGAGVILNEYINIGIDGEYLKGNKINVKVDALEGFSIKTLSLTNYEHEILSVIPNIVFKALSRQTYNIYNRLGVIVGIPLSVTENEDYQYQFTDSRTVNGNLLQRDISVEFNGEHKLKTSIGYQGALGIQMTLAEKLRGFFEVSVYGISFDRIKYADIKRVTTQKDLIARTGTSVEEKNYPPDNSRYIKYYKNSGVTNFSPPDERTGAINNYEYSSTFPQAPINMNAITLGIGLAFRF